MEGNCLPETLHPLPPPSATNILCNHELTRSNSEASSLTAENCQDIFRGSKNATLVDRRAWTDEKHNLYLHNLEASFVKQLHQSKRLLAQCSEQNQRDSNNASEQNDCWQKTDRVRGKPLASRTSADSHASLMNKRIHNCKRMCMHRPPLSAKMPEILKCTAVKRGKRMTSRYLATCSEETSSNNPYYHGVSVDLEKEGTGQNFLNEDNQSTSNIESQAKRSKTALADSSSQDQIVPLRKRPTDNSVINSSTQGEELAHHESVSGKVESFICPST